MRSTRRCFLALCAARPPAWAGKGQIFPSETRRYADPATEFEVLRLTDPAHSSYLPGPRGPAVSRRANLLLYSSDRTGGWQAFRMDWKTGESRQLTEARSLDPASLTLGSDERTICYLDGRVLHRMDAGSMRGHRVYSIPAGFDPLPELAISGDGLHAVLVEKGAGRHRIRLVRLATGAATTVTESAEPLSDPQPRPRRAGVLYRKGGVPWLVNYDGRDNRPMRVAPGGTGPARWSRDGRTFVYLNFPGDPKQLNSLREFTPDQNADRLLAPTSQFVQFNANHDGSVFIGASASKAQPFLLLLLRKTRREFALCEHRSSTPLGVNPVFDPSNQRILFNSDRHGKPAIYAMAVEKLVEKAGEP